MSGKQNIVYMSEIPTQMRESYTIDEIGLKMINKKIYENYMNIHIGSHPLSHPYGIFLDKHLIAVAMVIGESPNLDDFGTF